MAQQQNPRPDLQDDYILPFTVKQLSIRGRVIRLGNAIDHILERHNYPEQVSYLLAQMLCGCALIGSSLKFEGKLTLQSSSDGPIHLLICDFVAPSKLRAYAKFDGKTLQEKIDKQQTNLTDFLGKGHLAFNIQPSDSGQLYQGLVELKGQNFDEIIETYFEQSEQISTKIKLASAKLITKDQERPVYRAGGIFIQHLPENHSNQNKEILKDRFFEADALLETVSASELTDPTLSAEQLLFRLFHQRDPHVFEKILLQDCCSCSREKIETLLHSFTEQEIEEATKEGKISASCQFCNENYEFQPKDFEKKS